ncbi:MAG: FGGY family carbohydrate kinase [Halobellus sp.]|uniref:FGGY family carbohydrate kinase n=1 Tax=Halobellus sp. TaxID=1979212 RepID=UPI0035D4AC12
MTGHDVLVAVDAGTSTIKAVAFDTTGAEIAVKTRAIETYRPATGHAEQDMSTVWTCTSAAIGEVIDELPANATPLGVSITGQGDGLWAVTADGDPARNAILWSDSRASVILDEWDERGHLATIADQCGSNPYPGMSLPLLAWLACEEPTQFARIDTVLSCKDWLNYKLTGERTIDHCEATVPYLDKTTEEYDRSVFDLIDLPEAKELLPPLSSPTDVVGQVTPEAADATGLEAGLPVVAGAFDVPTSAIGSGTVTRGGTTVTLGTSLTEQVLVDGPQPETTGIQMSLGVEGLWTYAIGSNAGTPSLEWAAETIADDVSLAELEAIAVSAPQGSDGVMYHPYLSTTGERGPFVDPHARGQFIGLTPEHGTESLVRSVYEGLSFAVRDCVEHLPADPTTVTLTGGGTRSELWCQMLADTLDCPVEVPESSEPGAKGAAIILANAVGEFPSLAAAAEQMISTERRHEPRERATTQYERLYEAYASIREEMSSVWAHRAKAYDERARE